MIKLGNLVVAAGTSVNNTSTAVPFAIPLSVRELSLRTTGADLSFELLADTATTSTKTTTAAKGSPLAADVQLNGVDVPRYGPGAAAVLCAFNAGGGSETLEVWGSRVS